MANDLNLFGFGCILWLVSAWLIIRFRHSERVKSKQEDDPAATVEALRQECLRLQKELQQQSQQLKTDFQTATFYQLKTLLTNYPSVRRITEEKPKLLAKNFVPLFASLDNVLKSWEYEPIGSVWEQVPFNPQLHQPDSKDITEGELVYIRFVGYRQGDRILTPAKVSRTLPITITPPP